MCLLIDRQWVYQLCTELASFATSDSMDQPFGRGFPLGFVIRQQCTDLFGPDFNKNQIRKAVYLTNIIYNGYDLVLNRTVFTNGSIDPISFLGITSNKTGNVAVYIEGKLLNAIYYFYRIPIYL